uniref:Uncharacterized protein n=1 Tax=Stomoxys calcitrans TaxID=35570 RepID=A0A1I8QEI9_STOCA
MKAKVLECSAKEDNNVTELFKTMLSLSRFLPVGSSNEGTSGLKRRSSAYVSASSSRNKNRNASPSISNDKKSSLVDAVDPATSSDAKLKPRSRSLIRRASRKTKQQINNASEDCNLQ